MRSNLVSGVIAVVMLIANAAFAGNYVRVSPDLEIYYEEAGAGRPIIFIPGWTGTTAYLRQQVAHFSKRYRAIVYDPRSQGRTSKTPENNTYTQHGADLKAFMDALKLKDAVLVGHSWGCHDAYAYFRAFGTENVKGYVCLDQSPKDIMEKDGEWGTLRNAVDFKGFYEGIAYNRIKATHEFLQGMVTRPLTEEEKAWKTDELLKTPTSAAVSLMYDGSVADYTPEAKAIERGAEVRCRIGEGSVQVEQDRIDRQRARGRCRHVNARPVVRWALRASAGARRERGGRSCSWARACPR